MKRVGEGRLGVRSELTKKKGMRGLRREGAARNGSRSRKKGRKGSGGIQYPSFLSHLCKSMFDDIMHKAHDKVLVSSSFARFIITLTISLCGQSMTIKKEFFPFIFAKSLKFLQ